VPRPTSAPSAVATVALGAVLLFALLSNGRPIGAGDTRPTERVAASLVQEGNLDLDEYPEVEPPFARTEGDHRVSIYPVVSAILAAPVFVLARLLFALDETGTALAGKLAAALLSAVAAVILFRAVARRRPEADARLTALLFALATTVWSTSQALWQHPAAVLFLCLAVAWMARAEPEPEWAHRAGLPLGLAFAARHADVALVAVLLIGIAARFPKRIPKLVLWTLSGPLLVMAYDWRYFGSPLRHGFADSASRFAEPWGSGHLGLLVSPGKGLLVFTPVVALAAVGMARAFLRGERWLAGVMGAGVLAHWALMGRWTEWHGGESWGPRLMTDALPLLFLFLPEGFDPWPRLGAALAAISLAVQALGAFAYDYRWERLYERPPESLRAALWDPLRSPILFHLRERVVIFALPAVKGGRAIVREHPVVVFGPTGSRLHFRGEEMLVSGADANFEDVHLQRGARVQAGKLMLKGRWDGVFLRVRPTARLRRLDLRVTGRGRGTLYVGERSFWSDAPRWSTFAVGGLFRIRHPYVPGQNGGEDLTITVGRGGGDAQIDSVALVPPEEPEDVIRLP
jgi:hypothetical protein